MERWLVRAVRRCPLAVANDLGKCVQTGFLVRPVHVLKKPASIALIQVLGTGLKHARWS